MPEVTRWVVTVLDKSTRKTRHVVVQAIAAEDAAEKVHRKHPNVIVTNMQRTPGKLRSPRG